MIRKIIVGILAIALIAASLFLFNNLRQKQNKVRPVKPQKVTQVFTQEVSNTSIPINIKTSGNITAKNRMDLFAEVNGLFVSSTRPFKPGTYFEKGEELINIESQQQLLNLKSQRSNLFNQLVQLLPDLKFDYPEASPNWEKYISDFDIETNLSPLPQPSSDKEKLFIASRNVTTAYYNIKNLEEQFKKFIIRAPYSGILIESLIDPGTTIRTGQKLGEFISPYTFELEVAVNTSYGEYLEYGKAVQLYNADRSNSWTGKVKRINATVDPSTQTIPVYVEVRGKGLKEGMYLEADLRAKNENDVYEIDRKLLVNENQVYTVSDTLLKLMLVEPIYFKDKTVLVRGLTDGTKILANTIPGAHENMIVKDITK